MTVQPFDIGRFGHPVHGRAVGGAREAQENRTGVPLGLHACGRVGAGKHHRLGVTPRRDVPVPRPSDRHRFELCGAGRADGILELERPDQR